MSILIAVNYILVITMFPAAVVVVKDPETPTLPAVAGPLIRLIIHIDFLYSTTSICVEGAQSGGRCGRDTLHQIFPSTTATKELKRALTVRHRAEHWKGFLEQCSGRR